MHLEQRLEVSASGSPPSSGRFSDARPARAEAYTIGNSICSSLASRSMNSS